MTAPSVQDRQGNSGTASDAIGGKHGPGPSAAALDSMLSNDICQEHIEELEARVTGKFPAWLDGMMLRNGPGTFKGMQHLFDGYGMLAKFRFADGRVWVSNRFVESNSWKSFRDSGKMAFSEFGTGVSLGKNVWNMVKHYSGMGQGFTDNSNINVLPLPDGKTAVSMTEAAQGTYLVRIADLETLNRLEFKDDVKGLLTTAHPAILSDGSIVNFCSDIGGKYTVHRSQPGSEHRETIAQIPLRSGSIPSWVHDFPYTQNYMILPETPVYFDLKALASGKLGDYVIIKWKPEEESLLHVVPLDGKGPVRSFKAPRYFTFHYMNAYESEDGKQIHIDFACYDDPDNLNFLLLKNMRQGTMPVVKAPLKRMTLDLEQPDKPAEVVNLMQNDSSYVQAELPRVNPAYKGRPYRYGYSLAAGRSPHHNNTLAKYDMQTGDTLIWHEPGCLPTEPVMVPRQSKDGPLDEDDGVVLTVVAGGDGGTFLLALDAKTFEETGRAHLPFNMTYSFHGNYLPRPATTA
jgi:carlactone synthase/all-trans-10'-apo-beta-carotenal 13,14-cleaving dioxygenase